MGPCVTCAGPISAQAEAVLEAASRFCLISALHTPAIHVILHLFITCTTPVHLEELIKGYYQVKSIVII